jgi:adiponectin receptor
MYKITKPSKLLHFKDLAPWRQDNEYIHRGYRPLSNSYTKSLQSLVYVHNQTVNIYTHLLGFIFFGASAWIFRYTLYYRYQTATSEDAIVFGCFFAGVSACLGFSSAFHTFSNHSEHIYEQWLVLDFLGILCLIAGSWVPGVYYGFYCQRPITRFYLIMVCRCR